MPALGAVVTCGATRRVVGTFLDGPGTIHPVEFHELVALAWDHDDDVAVRFGLDLSPTGRIGVLLRGRHPLCTVADDGTIRLAAPEHAHVVACEHDFAGVAAGLAEATDSQDRTPPLGLVTPGADRDRRPRLRFDALLDDELDVVLLTARLATPVDDGHDARRAHGVHGAVRALVDRFGGPIVTT